MKKAECSSGWLLVVCSVVLLWGGVCGADEEAANKVYGELPVKEVTVFKDGHVYVLHEGALATDADGNILLDYLPNPVMGTFWAYSADPNIKLSSVVSSRDELGVEQPSVCVEDLMKGNVGKKIVVKEHSREAYRATIVRVLDDERQPESGQADAIRIHPCEPQRSGDKIVLLKNDEGIRAVHLRDIQAVTFLDQPSDKVVRKQQKDTMRLQLDWGGKEPEQEAVVGMAYVQRGIRWIPSYRVELNGEGEAVIKLQGTIVNELADMIDVKAHLVIGVPRFAFQDSPDPISFQEAVAQLSRHFRQDSSTAYSFSNAIMSQQSRSFDEGHGGRGRREQEGGGMNLGPELEGMGGHEDLFVFSLDHVTLKKGQRMVLQIAEYALSYTDIYTVDLSFSPPLEMRRDFNSEQQMQLAKLFHAPKAVHKIRLKNESEYPLTTAPATIFRDGMVLAQGMMTYTSIGNEGDLEITTAVNIDVKNSDEQTSSTPNAVRWGGNDYAKFDMKGSIELANYGDKAAKILVKRSVLGEMDAATPGGVSEQLGHGYNGFGFEGSVPFWWNWCRWPWWWYHLNSIGQASWTVELEPQEKTELEYEWHYFWR